MVRLAHQLFKRSRRRGDPVKIAVDGQTFDAEYLGKGSFCTAYRVGETVYLFQANADVADHSKEILAGDLWGTADFKNLPVVERHDDEEIRGQYYRVWSMHYIEPLTSKSKQAWEQYRKLEKADKEARAERWNKIHNDPNYAGSWAIKDAPYLNSMIVEKFRKAGGDESIAKSLDHLIDTSRNYGEDYSLEFSPRNLGVDIDGNLILRDVMFSSNAIDSKREKRKAQWGYGAMGQGR